METLGIIAGVRVEGNQSHVLDPSGWWDSGSTVLANLFQWGWPTLLLEYLYPVVVAAMRFCHKVQNIFNNTTLKNSNSWLQIQNLS